MRLVHNYPYVIKKLIKFYEKGEIYFGLFSKITIQLLSSAHTIPYILQNQYMEFTILFMTLLIGWILLEILWNVI